MSKSEYESALLEHQEQFNEDISAFKRYLSEWKDDPNSFFTRGFSTETFLELRKLGILGFAIKVRGGETNFLQVAILMKQTSF